MSTPRVSVVIPCYNLGEYLDEAVDSVLAQTFQDLEIVVVNDGSTDPATTARLAGYRRPRTRVITAEHRGVAAARNRGIREARGDYLCGLDADDKLAPRYLEKAMAILDADPGVAFVSSWLEAFGDESWVWRQEACDLPTVLAEDTVHGAALVRRSVLLEVGGYDESLAGESYEDWDLWLRVLERGYRGAIIPEVLLYYRRRAGSRSAIYRREAVHVDVMRELVARHAESYRRHLDDVLHRKETELARWLASCYELEHEVETLLRLQVESRRREVERLAAKLDEPARSRSRAGELAARVAELTDALARVERELQDVRRSKSWRVTAPLRAVYGILLGLAGRRS